MNINKNLLVLRSIPLAETAQLENIKNVRANVVAQEKKMEAKYVGIVADSVLALIPNQEIKEALLAKSEDQKPVLHHLLEIALPGSEARVSRSSLLFTKSGDYKVAEGFAKNLCAVVRDALSPVADFNCHNHKSNITFTLRLK